MSLPSSIILEVSSRDVCYTSQVGRMNPHNSFFSDFPDSSFKCPSTLLDCWMCCCDGLQCDLMCGHCLEAAPVAEEPIATEVPDQSPERQDTRELVADAVEEVKETTEAHMI